MEYSPVVDTCCGKVQGRVSYSREGRPFFEYTGIPYAKPPIGELRFEVRFVHVDEVIIKK